MAIGTTGTFDPTTGERRTTQFEYTPVDPNEEALRQAYEAQMAALNPPPPQPMPQRLGDVPMQYARQPQVDPVERAKAATAAAYKFIALRGYQQDLKNGASAADAFAKWGPMLVQDTSFAPALKALQAPAAYKYNEQTRAYEAPGQKPVFNPHAAPAAAPQWVPANPTTGEPAHYVGGGKVQFTPAQAAPKIDPLTIADYKGAEEEFSKALKVYQDSAETPEMRAEAGKRMNAAKVRMQNIRSTALPTGQPTAAPAVPTPAPAAPAQAAAPQKREGFPFAPMDKSKRLNGTIYSVPVTKYTPNGIAVWVGNGWIAQ